ncbi:MAG: hypothetical protein IPL72_02120 [Sulfuritalea sp.]|nr:hypothetical protein [Sulfuritalea sp.]
MIEGPGTGTEVGRVAEPDDLETRLPCKVSRQQLELPGKVLVYEKDAHA